MRSSTLFLLACLASFPAFAQATRTWVSGVGDDVNPCSRTAPCKTFAGAIAKTAAGGEINALDAAGYGAVTITKAITIDGHNVLAGIVAGGVNAITVNVGANDVVVLRGLTLKSTATTPSPIGVRFIAGKALHVEDCTLESFSTHGISLEAGSPASALYVKNTTISGVTSAMNAAAINVVGGIATLDRVTLTNNARGVVASSAAKVTLHAANVSGHAVVGVHAMPMTTVAIERSVVAGNGTGVLADNGGQAFVSDTMFSHNGVGVSGAVSSFGNNRLNAGNNSNGVPAATLSQQ